MIVFYRLSIPRIERKGKIILPRQFLLRAYGSHKVVISEKGSTSCLAYTSSQPIEMTLPKALKLVKMFADIPYIYHYTRYIKLKVIGKEL